MNLGCNHLKIKSQIYSSNIMQVQWLHLLPVDDQAEYPHHPARAVHQVLLDMIPRLALGLSITREIGLMEKNFYQVSDIKTFIIKDSDIFQ